MLTNWADDISPYGSTLEEQVENSKESGNHRVSGAVCQESIYATELIIKKWKNYNQLKNELVFFQQPLKCKCSLLTTWALPQAPG